MPSTKFPDRGDIVIRVGYNMTVNWVSQDVSEVNVFFIKKDGESSSEKIHIIRRPSYNGKNSYTFAIDDSMFDEEYFPCRIEVADAQNSSIIKNSDTFKILRGN